MSVSINQQLVSELTDLSESAQTVIGLLPGATQLFSRLLQNGKVPFQFANEFDFINDIWVGTNGTEACFCPSLGTWCTVASLYYMEPLDQQALKDTSARNATTRKNLCQKYGWLTHSNLQQLEDYKSEHGLTDNPLFVTAKLNDLYQFFSKFVAVQPEESAAEAFEFAVSHACNYNAFTDLAQFYQNSVRLLENNDPKRQSKVSSLLQSLLPAIEDYLIAPVSKHPPSEAELTSLQNHWLAQTPLFGFKDVNTGLRILSELVELTPDNPQQALSNIAKGIETISSFFKSNSANGAFPAQSGDSWFYQYKGSDFTSYLEWMPSGSLCMSNFVSTKIPKPKPQQKAKPTGRKPRQSNKPKTPGSKQPQ